MQKKKVEIVNETGLHARPASTFVKTAGAYKSDIKLLYNGQEINAKSIMGLMSMGIGQGSEIIIQTEGEDENEALNELTELIESGFGEE